MYTLIWSVRAKFYVLLVRVAHFFHRRNTAIWAAGRYAICVNRLQTQWYRQRIAAEKKNSKQYPPGHASVVLVEPVDGELIIAPKAVPYQPPPEPKLGVVIGPNAYGTIEYSHKDGMDVATGPLTDMRKFDPNDEITK